MGDKITNGQKLSMIDSSDLANLVALSQAAYDQANNNLQKSLNTQPYTSFDLDNLQQTINSAQAKVNMDQSNLNATMLTSTSVGIVTRINGSVGDNAQAGSNSTTPQQSNTPSSAFITIADSNGNNRNINFSVSGKISEIDVSLNQSVTNGQLVVRLDQTSFINTLTQSQASLNQANNNLQKEKTTPGYNQYDINNLQENITLAKNKLNTDKSNLNNATLSSSIDRVVASINANVGDSVNGDNGKKVRLKMIV